MSFHEGEIAVQNRAGVSRMAGRVGASIRSTIPEAAQYFISQQPLVFIASVDGQGQVWAFLLAGEIGFAKAIDENTLKIEAHEVDELLLEHLKVNNQVGLLAIEFETRRRMRVNGRAWASENTIFVQTDEVFSNCPKYIQARVWERSENKSGQAKVISSSVELTEKQMDFIREADTFIIASHHKTRGADASHRGGNAGFVRVRDNKNLVFPDYSGNMMFQTLGNLELNPNSGLLFIDFKSGRLLQLTGKAKIVWDDELKAEFAGAERVIEFELNEARETEAAANLSWGFIDYSPFNPK
jgi:predicted pyridoxine 5'-phosphate oxidase superfamily flavin-nucleotide-binding protein